MVAQMVKNARDLGLVPGLGKFPWRWAWQPAPVFLPGKTPWAEEPGRLESRGHKELDVTECLGTAQQLELCCTSGTSTMLYINYTPQN